MLGSFRAFPGRVVATAGLGTRLLRRGTEGSFVGGGKIRAIEKCFSQPYILKSGIGFSSSSSSKKTEKKEHRALTQNRKRKVLRPGSDMKAPIGLEQLRANPHETPQQINDRIFGSFPQYQDAKERGSVSPVMDAYRESADPVMLETMLQLARDVLPTRTGPRRNNVKKRERLRLKSIRKQHCIYREQKMIALEQKVKKKVEKRNRDRDAIAAAIADDVAWLKEKSELISKHREGQKE